MGTLFFYYLFCSCLEETAELEESRRGGSPKGIFCVGLFLRARALDLDLNLDDVVIGGGVDVGAKLRAKVFLSNRKKVDKRRYCSPELRQSLQKACSWKK